MFGLWGDEADDAALRVPDAALCAGLQDSSSHGATGDKVDLMIDSGSTATVCGPQHFRDSPIQPGPPRRLRSVTGDELEYYGQKKVTLESQGQRIQVDFAVLNVARPIVATGEGESGLASKDIETHLCEHTKSCEKVSYLKRPTKGCSERLGLVSRAGRTFLQVVVTGSVVLSPDNSCGSVVSQCMATELVGTPANQSRVDLWWEVAPICANTGEEGERASKSQDGLEVQDALVPMDVAAPEARGVKAPEEPTPEQRERHNLTHIPFAPWCDDCARGRCPDDPHPSKSEKSPLPVIQIDYFFVRTDQDMILAKGLSAIDSVYGRTLAVDCQQKGASDKSAVKQLVNYTRSLGFERAHLQHDKENSITEVANAVATKILGVMPRETPKASKQSLGAAERFHRTVEGLMRTLRLSIERIYGVSLHATHTITAWMMRHAAWLHDHYQVHRVDNQTSYKRHQLRDYSSAVVPFAETGAWREPAPHVAKLKENWGQGNWVGR
jgi:hypothetical protein